MGFREHMVVGAEKATGDKTVTAGLFQRIGAETAAAIHGGVGVAAGAAVDRDQAFSTGEAASMAAGSASAGPKGAGEAVQFALQVVVFVVALSEAHVYVLKPAGFRDSAREKLELLQTFPRGQV
jgi:hypothetical protein